MPHSLPASLTTCLISYSLPPSQPCLIGSLFHSFSFSLTSLLLPDSFTPCINLSYSHPCLNHSSHSLSHLFPAFHSLPLCLTHSLPDLLSCLTPYSLPDSPIPHSVLASLLTSLIFSLIHSPCLTHSLLTSLPHFFLTPCLTHSPVSYSLCHSHTALLTPFLTACLTVPALSHASLSDCHSLPASLITLLPLLLLLSLTPCFTHSSASLTP